MNTNDSDAEERLKQRVAMLLYDITVYGIGVVTAFTEKYRQQWWTLRSGSRG